MPCYHASPTGGLRVLRPTVSKGCGTPARVCMTTLRPMALLYLARNYEYPYGFDQDGVLCYNEYFPGALEELYGGRPGWLYTCAGGNYAATGIPNERIAYGPVEVVSAEFIPDALQALRRAEREGELRIRRYEELTPAFLARVEEAQCRTIREKQLLEARTPMAAYYRRHYPAAWEKARC